MPGLRHNVLVEDICVRYGAKKTGFGKALMSRLIADYDEYLDDWVRFSPDAYLVNEAKKEIIFYEVELSHELSDQALQRYVTFWFESDCEEWTIRLVSIDRYGNEQEIDLMKWFYIFERRAA